VKHHTVVKVRRSHGSRKRHTERHAMNTPGWGRRFIRTVFGAWSGTYDWSFLQPILYRPTHAAVMRAVAELPALDRVLDLGCGTARLTADFAVRFPVARVTGVDLTPGMLRAARRRVGSLPISLVAGDAYRLPIRSASQSLVTSTIAYHWMTEPAIALAEIRRVLKPGGHLVLGTLISRLGSATFFNIRYARESTHHADLTAAGFSVLSSTRVGHRVAVFVARL
jgi:ubiquinone/menaquinone biosynthesis C-methylase UbiE